jgi:hypothetical protein
MRIFSTSILTAAILAMTACDGWCASMKTPAGGTGSSAAASNRLVARHSNFDRLNPGSE